MAEEIVVDARNTFCPGPLMELISFMKRAEVGDQLELLSNDEYEMIENCPGENDIINRVKKRILNN